MSEIKSAAMKQDIDSLSAEGAANREDLKLAAIFMGFTEKSYTSDGEKMWCDEKHGLPVGELQFNSSWDWQVPLFSKVAKEFWDYCLSVPHTNANNMLDSKMIKPWNSAVFNNDPAAGFAVIVEAIKWMQQQKKK